MSAIESNIVNTNRHNLGEVLLLDTPYSLAIDPCNACNFQCKFCAIQNTKEQLNYKKQLLDISLYKKIIDDIQEFPHKLKVLRLSGQGEPLLNENLPEMIQYAKGKEVADYIEIVTNGSRLSPQLNQKLVDSGVDRIRISIEAVDDEGYLDITQKEIDFEGLVDNIRDLHQKSGDSCEIYIKIVDIAVRDEEKREKFKNIFGEICDRIWVDQVIPLWSDFEELNNVIDLDANRGMHGQKLQKVEVCPFAFYNLVINPDGEVTVCCADWKRKLVVGDLRTETMLEVWNGNKLRSFWREMLKGNKNSFEMCQRCVLPMYDCNDNIDMYAKQILERMAKGECQ